MKRLKKETKNSHEEMRRGFKEMKNSQEADK